MEVGSKGKETLKKSSIARKDRLFSEITPADKVFVHNSCRSIYVNKNSVEAAKRKIESQNKLQISPEKEN